ncbi:hypothetical protein HII31_06116 [Pseudocercospora fuligena]|uniref:N-acetyltransferase domain-containing protein n=1 Tax=Pseudocercospora fuligena TaxID=685502 RepID=A0A8H6VLL0_9PEZI|nr:hypothetical protein HII31_06116 [Pseudocercospora fuligena]
MDDKNLNEVILELENGITVRRYRSSDVQSMTKHGNSKTIWLNMRDRFPHPYDEAAGRSWISINADPGNHARSGKYTLEAGAEGPLVPTNYAIAINGEAIGSIGLDFGADIYYRTAELGYWIGEEFWGKGIMSVVAPAFVRWTWKTFGVLIRINAEANERNLGSIRTLVKAGFAYEGKRINAIVKMGEVQSVVWYGALRPAD